MIYYKISEEDLFNLTKDSIKLIILENNGVDNWSGYDLCWEEMPADEDIYEEINSLYKIID